MPKILKITRISFSGPGHFEYFLKPIFFFFFKSESVKSAKINSLKVYPLFSLSISLMTLIVAMSFNGYCLKGTKCWEHEFIFTKYIMKILF